MCPKRLDECAAPWPTQVRVSTFAGDTLPAATAAFYVASRKTIAAVAPRFTWTLAQAWRATSNLGIKQTGTASLLLLDIASFHMRVVSVEMV